MKKRIKTILDKLTTEEQTFIKSVIDFEDYHPNAFDSDWCLNCLKTYNIDSDISKWKWCAIEKRTDPDLNGCSSFNDWMYQMVFDNDLHLEIKRKLYESAPKYLQKHIDRFSKYKHTKE